MGTVTIAGMRAAEARAIALDWSEESLLDLAGERLGHAIGRFFPGSGTAIGYLGKGHNAGDALVALKILRDEFGWRIGTRPAFPPESCAPLAAKKWKELGTAASWNGLPPWNDFRFPLVLLDGLVGIGAQGALREPLLSLAREMAWLRQQAGARVAAVDLPSGVDADLGLISEDAVRADVTFMIANAKRGLLSGQAADATGALALVEVAPLSDHECADVELISPQTMAFGKNPRHFDFHKGQAGKIGILAGSKSYTGAAVLAAIGALRGGAGLITLLVPEDAADLISSKCPPEIIIRGIQSPESIRSGDFDALVLGCGLGEIPRNKELSLLSLIRDCEMPMLIDADALNLMAKHDASGILRPNHLLTPHPGEFRRLAPTLADLPRETAAREFAIQYPSTLLLKGARTIITRRDFPLWINSTGNAGMATGGQGDLLSGVIGALLAIGHPTHEAAMLGAWICGRAAEIAANREDHSEESQTPSDVAKHIGTAFLDWRRSGR